MKLHDLHETRARLVSEMRALTETAEAETRDLNEAEDSKFKTLKGELATLDRRIERATEIAEAERRAPAIIHGDNRGDGTFETRARDFSLVKAINASLGDVTVDAGFEREISAEVQHRSGRKFVGIAVPDEFFLEKRVQTVGTDQSPGSAMPLYPTQHRDDLYIDALRANIVVGRLGATVIDNCVGTQEIPRQTGSSTAQWIAEEGDLSGTDAAHDDVVLQPRTVGAITSFSRRTLINASPSIENIVRRDLASVIANAIDQKAMLGDGSSNTPVGVIHQTGAHNLPLMGGATWEKLLEFPAAIQHSDADIGTLAWVMNAWVQKKLRATPKDITNGGEGFLMEGPSALAGYPVAVTSALPGDPDLENSPPVPVAGTLIFGAFSQVLLAYWSGTDILVNAYETDSFTKGRVRIRAMRDCDVGVRHGESFAYASDVPVF